MKDKYELKTPFTAYKKQGGVEAVRWTGDCDMANVIFGEAYGVDWMYCGEGPTITSRQCDISSIKEGDYIVKKPNGGFTVFYDEYMQKFYEHDALPALMDRLALVEKELEESKARVKMLKYGFNIPNDGTTEQRTLKEIIRFCYTDGPMTEMFPDPEDFLPEEEGLTPEQVDAQLRMAGYTDADFDRMHKKVSAVIAECRAKAADTTGDSK